MKNSSNKGTMKKLVAAFIIAIMSIAAVVAQQPVNRYGGQNKSSNNVYSVYKPKTTTVANQQPRSKTVAAVPQGPIKHYTNSEGYKVQSPTRYSSAPAGATAVCRDGTYSFSRNKRGTCSHHGGVAYWLK